MIEKRGIKIYDFSLKDDRSKLEEMFESLLQLKDLVPIIGSGFSRGLRTKEGVVPSADELREEMISIMHNIDDSDENEFDGIALKDLSDVF